MNDNYYKIEIGNVILTRYFRICRNCDKQLFKIVDIKLQNEKDKTIQLQCTNCSVNINVKYKKLEKYLNKMQREELNYKKSGYYDSDNLKNTDALSYRVSGSFGSGKRK